MSSRLEELDRRLTEDAETLDRLDRLRRETRVPGQLIRKLIAKTEARIKAMVAQRQRLEET